MDRIKEVGKILKETLKVGAVGVLGVEGKLCPVTVISVTEEHIRVSRGNLAFQIFAGMPVGLELCSNRGCLVIQTEVIDVPESPDEGILLAIPETYSNIFPRQFWRIPVNLPAEIKPHAHPRKIKAIIQNISAGGMLITIEEPLEVGESIEVFFSLKVSALTKEVFFRLLGSVTHIVVADDKYRVSLKFVGMDPEDERKINEFVIKTLRASCPKLNL